MLLLRRVVAHVDLRPELHFLRFDLALVLASLLGLDGLVVLELAVIHDAAHGRFSLRSDLDQVVAFVISDAGAREIELSIADMTSEERAIVKAGCLINYNREK